MAACAHWTEPPLPCGAGSIHGLIGQNGAGKSTIIKILAGMIQADGGTIEINGQPHTHTSTRALERMGVYIIHQDRLLVPTFTVGEALFLGNEPKSWGIPLLNRRVMERRAAALLREFFEIELPFGCLIAELTMAQQKIVQITRALLHNPTILVLDEPTAALVKREVDLLFVALRRMRERGISLIYISHYLGEIEELCDEVTVLRNGRSVGVLDPRTTSREDVVAMMVARNIDELFPKHTVVAGEAIMRVSGLSRRREYEDVSFELRRGEILGITGLVGSGTKELFRTLFGLQKATSGTIEVHGKQVRLNSPLDAIHYQMAMVPEDRRAHGVAMSMTIQENITLASLGKFSRFGFLAATRERTAVEALIAKLGIVTSGPNALIRELSGGNQQKVAVAKWLSRDSSIYLLDEPTVAVDVGAKVDIYNLMHELTAKGASILMHSTDLVELTGVCDRMLVMYRGRIVNEYQPGVSSDEVLRCATGA